MLTLQAGGREGPDNNQDPGWNSDPGPRWNLQNPDCWAGLGPGEPPASHNKRASCNRGWEAAHWTLGKSVHWSYCNLHLSTYLITFKQHHGCTKNGYEIGGTGLLIFALLSLFCCTDKRKWKILPQSTGCVHETDKCQGSECITLSMSSNLETNPTSLKNVKLYVCVMVSQLHIHCSNSDHSLSQFLGIYLNPAGRYFCHIFLLLLAI